MILYNDTWADFPTVTAQQKGVTRGGHFYTKPEVKAAHDWFKWKFASSFPKRSEFPDKEKAFRVCIHFHYRHSKKKFWGKPKITRPDVDNQTKIILDSITHSHLIWWDDSQVTELIVCKSYSMSSYIQISIADIESEGDRQ